MAKREVKQWITVHGVHVPIYEGQAKDEAVKKFNSHWGPMTEEEKKQRDKFISKKDRWVNLGTNDNPQRLFIPAGKSVAEVAKIKETDFYKIDKFTGKKLEKGIKFGGKSWAKQEFENTFGTNYYKEPEKHKNNWKDEDFISNVQKSIDNNLKSTKLTPDQKIFNSKNGDYTLQHWGPMTKEEQQQYNNNIAKKGSGKVEEEKKNQEKAVAEAIKKSKTDPTKYKQGDFAKIKKEYLADYEDPNDLYYVVEDQGDRLVVSNFTRNKDRWNDPTKGLITQNTWAKSMFEKQDYTLEDLNNKIKPTIKEQPKSVNDKDAQYKAYKKELFKQIRADEASYKGSGVAVDEAKEISKNKTELTAAQKESLRQTKDYNEETYDNLIRKYNNLYDDRAYDDPYFDRDEYEDDMAKVFNEMQKEINRMRALADKKTYIGWSQEDSNQNLRDAAKLERKLRDLKLEYEKQRRNGRYRTA